MGSQDDVPQAVRAGFIKKYISTSSRNYNISCTLPDSTPSAVVLHSPIPRPLMKTGNDVCADVEFLALCIAAFKRNASAVNPKCYKL